MLMASARSAVFQGFTITAPLRLCAAPQNSLKISTPPFCVHDCSALGGGLLQTAYSWHTKFIPSLTDVGEIHLVDCKRIVYRIEVIKAASAMEYSTVSSAESTDWNK
jgi:hypothetical protein